MTSTAGAAALLPWARTQTWAMEERALEATTGALVALSRGQTGEIEAARAALSPGRRPTRSETAVAVLPVTGVITYRPGLFSMFFGGTTIKDLLRELQAAMDEPSVRSILMPIDSPGGTVTGLIEVAAALRAAREKKRIVAVVDPFAASAAYWIAAQASEIVSIPSGETGSIGVFALHLDFSEQLKQDGIKPTFVTSTPEKVEGSRFEPLSADARADMQRNVMRVYNAFLADVARGRQVDVATVREKFGRGRMIDAARAKAVGMIDRIGTFDEALARLLSARPGGAATATATAQPSLSDKLSESLGKERSRKRRLDILRLG